VKQCLQFIERKLAKSLGDRSLLGHRDANELIPRAIFSDASLEKPGAGFGGGWIASECNFVLNTLQSRCHPWRMTFPASTVPIPNLSSFREIRGISPYGTHDEEIRRIPRNDGG
jgi:hypothetical protein